MDLEKIRKKLIADYYKRKKNKIIFYRGKKKVFEINKKRLKIYGF